MITTPDDAVGHRTDADVIHDSVADPERFATIYDAYFADIHRYVERRLGPDVADDLAAETFLEAFRGRGHYDLSRPHARPWLYGIATNLVGRHRRREEARYRALARAAPGDPATTGGEDELADRLSAAAAQPALVRALGGLAARDRDVVLLIALAQFDHDEVAEALGIPVGTVRSRLHRARRRLRRDLPAHLAQTLETRHG